MKQLKIHVAAKLLDYTRVIDFQRELNAKGYVISLDWASNAGQYIANPSTVDLHRLSGELLSSIHRCDVLIYLAHPHVYASHPEAPSAYAEMVVALAIDKKVIVVRHEELDPQDAIYFHDENIIWTQTTEEAIQKLDTLRRCCPTCGRSEYRRT